MNKGYFVNLHGDDYYATKRPYHLCNDGVYAVMEEHAVAKKVDVGDIQDTSLDIFLPLNTNIFVARGVATKTVVISTVRILKSYNADTKQYEVSDYVCSQNRYQALHVSGGSSIVIKPRDCRRIIQALPRGSLSQIVIPGGVGSSLTHWLYSFGYRRVSMAFE